MNKFESYLIGIGIHLNTRRQYTNTVVSYLSWLKQNNLTPARVKRTKFTDFLQYCREQGNKDRTITAKEGAVKHYYNFLGTKHNPAKSWIKRKKEYKLPPKGLEKEELVKIYESLNPKSPAEYRDRCMLGFVLFQGLLRSELMELRLSDVDFKGEVFIQGQLRTNSRTLKLEPFQLMHLYDYKNKFRKEFLVFKEVEPDNFFLSKGTGSRLDNALTLLLKKLRKQFPQIIDLKHIRGSVISNWDKEEGIVEAMTKAGHRYISSTTRFQTGKYDELKEELKTLHPLENLELSFF
jgi:integrase/recombinase XerD